MYVHLDYQLINLDARKLEVEKELYFESSDETFDKDFECRFFIS